MTIKISSVENKFMFPNIRVFTLEDNVIFNSFVENKCFKNVKDHVPKCVNNK